LESEEYGPSLGNNYRQASSYDGERDKKLDAMNNTAARGVPPQKNLLGKWAFIECPPPVRKAGEVLINYVDADGYIRTDLETVRKEAKEPQDPAALQEAQRLIQTLEPPGIGARDLRECLLLQLRALEDDAEAAEGHDFELERSLIGEHLKDLEMNRYPQISRKLGR